jgi:hypothetical protein
MAFITPITLNGARARRAIAFDPVTGRAVWVDGRMIDYADLAYAADTIDVAPPSAAKASGVDVHGHSSTPAEIIQSKYAPGWPGSPGTGRVFDLPPQPVQRYQVEKITSPYRTWRSNHKCRSISHGKTLRIELRAPAMIHWSVDDWRTVPIARPGTPGLVSTPQICPSP